MNSSYFYFTEVAAAAAAIVLEAHHKLHSTTKNKTALYSFHIARLCCASFLSTNKKL